MQGPGFGIEHLLRMSPMVSMASPTSLRLPAVEAPSLEGLSVYVPAPPDLLREDLLRAFHEERRSVAQTRLRGPGESLALGDAVRLNIVGYCDGELIPFSPRFGMTMELSPVEALPGFSEALIEGGTVGGSLQIAMELPGDYPVEAYRGRPARFLVDVVAANEVTLLPEDAPGFFERLGRGDTLEEVMDALLEELEEEQAAHLWLDAQNLVMEELRKRAPVTLPRALVDEEIRRRWAQAEGQGMVQQQFDVNEQREAFDAWLRDPATREEAERRLHIGILLKAITEAHQLELSPEKLESLVYDQLEPFGFTEEDARAAMRETPETTRKLAEMGWYLLAVEYVMNHAKVRFEGADEAFG